MGQVQILVLIMVRNSIFWAQIYEVFEFFFCNGQQVAIFCWASLARSTYEDNKYSEFLSSEPSSPPNFAARRTSSVSSCSCVLLGITITLYGLPQGVFLVMNCLYTSFLDFRWRFWSRTSVPWWVSLFLRISSARRFVSVSWSSGASPQGRRSTTRLLAWLPWERLRSLVGVLLLRMSWPSSS